MGEVSTQPNEPQHVSGSLEEAIQRVKNRAKGAPNTKEDMAARHLISERQQLASALSRSVGTRFAASRCSLETYRIYHDNQKPVLEHIAKILDSLPRIVKEGRGLIWLGDVGTGKDHLAIALMHFLTRHHGISCEWIRGLDLYGRIRDRMDNGRNEEELLTEMARPMVLCISDPVASVGELSAWRTEFLQRLIDRRYNNLQSTWVTINARSTDEADSKLSAQVFDRLQEGAEIFHCSWPSHREVKKR